MKYLKLLLFFFFIALKGQSQANESSNKIDSIHVLLKQLKAVVDKSVEFKNNIEPYQKQITDDSLKIKKLENELEKIKDERDKAKLENSKNTTEIDNIKSEQNVFLGEIIKNIVNESSSISTTLLTKLKERALKYSPSNADDIETFIQIRDSLLVLKKVLENEYEITKISAAKISWNNLAGLAKKHSNKFTKLNKEVEDLGKQLNNYCTKSNEIYKELSNIYILRNDFSKENNSFKEACLGLRYKVKDFPFLFKLLEDYYEKEPIQNKYKTLYQVKCN